MKTIMLIHPHFRRQTGAALIVCLLMLSVVLLLGVAAAQIALQEEKTSRNDMDRQIAFQAAQAALSDAELDIQASPDADRSRSHLFSIEGLSEFSENGNFACGAGSTNKFLGVCLVAEDETPSWQIVDFLDTAASSMQSVPYGQFTGQEFQAGVGTIAEQVPRYLIEVMLDKMPGQYANQQRYIYRITAIGFGMRQKTQVVLQALYRKLE